MVPTELINAVFATGGDRVTRRRENEVERVGGICRRAARGNFIQKDGCELGVVDRPAADRAVRSDRDVDVVSALAAAADGVGRITMPHEIGRDAVLAA